jgi:choline kinase
LISSGGSDLPGSRTGLVLAAGFGSRLAGVSDRTRLKPLTPVGGRPLMLRTLDSLAEAGCVRAVIVVGYGGLEVEEAIRARYEGSLELVFVTNDRYELSNGVSVLAARGHVSGTFVLTMADHVFGDEVMRLAAGHTPPERGATLLVDSKLDQIFDMDDAMKVVVRDGSVAGIGKQLARYDAIDTGLFVCTDGLMEELDAELRDRGDASLSDGVSRLARQGRMRVLDIGDGFWQDVDTPEMLGHADAMLLRRAR